MFWTLDHFGLETGPTERYNRGNILYDLEDWVTNTDPF